MWGLHTMTSPKPAQSSRRGGALLTVLWLSAALAAIGFSVSVTVRAETARASTNADGMRAAYLASGAVERAMQWMMWGSDYRNPDGGPMFWEPNMSRMVMHFPTGEAIVEMIPESAKMNVNTATPEDLERLIAVVSGDPGVATRLTQEILNWRGGGTGGLDAFYAGLGPTFRPRHASFQEIEELLALRGMTPELFHGNFRGDAAGRLYPTGGLKESLSVIGSNGPYDANSISPALAESLGIPTGAVNALLKARAFRPLKDPGALAELGISNPKLMLGGNWIWTLRATARLRLPDGRLSDVVRSASATVKILDRKNYAVMPMHVIRYYDDAWSLFSLAPPLNPMEMAPAGAHMVVR